MKHQFPSLEQLICKDHDEIEQSNTTIDPSICTSIETPVSETVPLFQKNDRLVVTDSRGHLVGSVHQTDVL